MHATRPAGFLAGDSGEPALGGLIRAHGEDLVRLAYCLLGDREAARDAAQAGFISLREEWDRHHGEVPALAHLRSAVIRECRTVPLHPGPIDVGRSPLAAAVRALPERKREVVVCRYYLGLDDRDTARLLDLETGAVRRSAHRALAALMGDEGSVAEALHAYADGLTVSEDELDRVERVVHDRRHLPTRREGRPLRQWLVAVCAIGGLLLGGLALRSEMRGGAGELLVTSDLAGLWRVDTDHYAGSLWMFDADGRVAQASNPGRLLDRHRAGGSFEVRDEEVLLRTFGCEATWRVRLSVEGRLSGTVAQAGPGCVPGAGQPVALTRVSPASVAGASLSPLFGGSSPVPVTHAGQLRGTWLLRGSGTILTVLSRSGEPQETVYQVDDDGDALWAPDQEGGVAVRPDGSVVFTSGDGPHAWCDTVYSSAIDRLATIDAQLSPLSCGRFGGLADTWVRLN